jgi:hypothetical protein
LIVTDWLFVPPALVAVQVSVVPVVLVLIVVEPHPEEEEIDESGSLTVHETFTSLVYQPLFPSVPLTLGVMTGLVVSLGATTRTVTVVAILSSSFPPETLGFVSVVTMVTGYVPTGVAAAAEKLAVTL